MIYMITTEHCPKCAAALQQLESKNCDLSEDNFKKLVVPQDELGVEIATAINASSAPAFAKDVDGTYVTITLEQAIEELS